MELCSECMLDLCIVAIQNTKLVHCSYSHAHVAQLLYLPVWREDRKQLSIAMLHSCQNHKDKTVVS